MSVREVHERYITCDRCKTTEAAIDIDAPLGLVRMALARMGWTADVNWTDYCPPCSEAREAERTPPRPPRRDPEPVSTTIIPGCQP